MTPDPYQADYTGPAVLAVGGARLDVTVALAGHLEPIDGRYHWYGRVTGADPVSVPAARREVTLTVADGEPASAKLGERDPWGHLRITGVGAPPYRR